MTSANRRTALQRLAVALPAAWSAPVVLTVTLPAHAQTTPADGPGSPVIPPGPQPRAFRGALQFGGLGSFNCSENSDVLSDAISAGDVTIEFLLNDDDTFTITFEPFGSLSGGGTLDPNGSFDVPLTGGSFGFGTAIGCTITNGNASGMLSPDGELVSGQFQGTAGCAVDCEELDIMGSFELVE